MPPPSSLLVLLVLVPLLLAVGALVVVSAAAAAFFFWSRERCRWDSCGGDALLLGLDDGPEEEEEEEEPQPHDAKAAGTGVTGAGDLVGEHERERPPRRRRGSQEDVMIQALLGKPRESVTADDIKGLLGKDDFMRLFTQLPPATPAALHGEWHVDVLAMGWNFPLAYLLLHWRMGRGWYLGKGFDAAAKEGYNTFYNHGQISRSRRFDLLYEGPSAYDEQRSLHLVYGRFNAGLFGRVHEEVRCLHPELFLALGSLNLKTRSSFNSIPFLVVGPRQPVQPWDRERN